MPIRDFNTVWDSDNHDRDVSQVNEASWANVRNGSGELVSTSTDSYIEPFSQILGNKPDQGGGTLYTNQRVLAPFLLPTWNSDTFNKYFNKINRPHIYHARLRLTSRLWTVQETGDDRKYLTKIKLIQGKGVGQSITAADYPFANEGGFDRSYDDSSDGVTISATNNVENYIDLNDNAIQDINSMINESGGGYFNIGIVNYEHDYLNSDPSDVFNVANNFQKRGVFGCSFWSGHASGDKGPKMTIYFSQSAGKVRLYTGKLVINAGKITL